MSTVMKIIALSYFLFLSFNLCVVQKSRTNIEFTIVKDIVQENSSIWLLINNKTSSNYYLPIINSFESERWKYMLSRDEFFFSCIWEPIITIIKRWIGILRLVMILQVMKN